MPLMSFSIAFTATSRGHARRLLKEKGLSLPPCVYQFLAAAIEGLREAREDEKRAIRVCARGHLCDGPNAYQASEAQIEVTPLLLDD